MQAGSGVAAASQPGSLPEMAQRQGWIELAARLPWWAAVLLALVAYLAGTALAGMPLNPANPLTAVAVAGGAVLRIVVPVLLILGAVVRLVSGARRSALFGRAAAPDGDAAIAGMTWAQFEALLGEAYRRRGYSVTELGQGGADGGVDLVLRRDGAKTLVQCKHWRAQKVGVTVVRELAGVMAVQRAAAGVVVTSGRFTDEARAFAAAAGVELVDGRALPALLGRVPAPEPVPTSDAETPACPACGGPMVKRQAKRGTSGPFWGCSTFPRCRGMRKLGQ